MDTDYRQITLLILGWVENIDDKQLLIEIYSIIKQITRN